MSSVRYLVDNNVLSQLSRGQRKQMADRGDCWIPSEVLHEASGFPDIRQLREMEYPLTSSVVEQLRMVMGRLKPGEFDLVDLYGYEGNADPILIACALDAPTASEATLFPEEWLIATDDRALCDAAKAFSVRTISSDRFIALFAD